MKIHRIVFFVGLLLIINQFLGIPSDLKVVINIILGIILVGLGLYIKLQNVKKSIADPKNTSDQNIFVENIAEQAVGTEATTTDDVGFSPEIALDNDINETINALDDNDEFKETQ